MSVVYFYVAVDFVWIAAVCELWKPVESCFSPPTSYPAAIGENSFHPFPPQGKSAIGKKFPRLQCSRVEPLRTKKVFFLICAKLWCRTLRGVKRASNLGGRGRCWSPGYQKLIYLLCSTKTCTRWKWYSSEMTRANTVAIAFTRTKK